MGKPKIRACLDRMIDYCSSRKSNKASSGTQPDPVIMDAIPAELNRNDRQREVHKWRIDTFGIEAATSKTQCIARLLEEAIELAQAEGMTQEYAEKIVTHVFSKDPGDPKQEVGGLSVSLLGYCENTGFSADELEQKELQRIRSKDAQYFRDRQNIKMDAGVSMGADCSTSIREL